MATAGIAYACCSALQTWLMENLHRPTVSAHDNQTYPMYLVFHGVSLLQKLLCCWSFSCCSASPQAGSAAQQVNLATAVPSPLFKQHLCRLGWLLLSGQSCVFLLSKE